MDFHHSVKQVTFESFFANLVIATSSSNVTSPSCQSKPGSRFSSTFVLSVKRHMVGFQSSGRNILSDLTKILFFMKDGFPSNLLNSEGPQFLETEVEGEPVGDIALVVPVYQRVVVVHVVGGQS